MRAVVYDYDLGVLKRLPYRCDDFANPSLLIQSGADEDNSFVVKTHTNSTLYLPRMLTQLAGTVNSEGVPLVST